MIDTECSKNARFLVCASIFPFCSPDVPRPVPACKSLCEKVKTECAQDRIITSLWPKFLECDSLPEPEKQGLCMEGPQEPTPPMISSSLPSSSATVLNNSLPHLIIPSWPSWRYSFKQSATCPTNFTLSFGTCVPQCGTDALYSTQQKKIAELWILCLSAICLIFTLFSLVTFWAETERFGFPERPVLFLTLCYNLLSICYLERIIFHDPKNEGLEDMIDGLSCGINPPCLASYITTSYLTLSAASWWLVFSLCWYLSTAKQWSSEALERKSGLFHVLAWVPPLAPPIGALLWGAVKPHELTGLCTAPGYTEIPALVLLGTGAIFTILAARSLRNLRNSWQYDKLSQVMTRIIVFGSIYFIPATLAVILSFFEDLEPTVQTCQINERCSPPNSRSTAPTLARLFLMLAGGSLTGMWVWSKKTCNSCKSRISTQPLTPTISKSSNSVISKKPKGGTPSLYPGIHFQRAPISAHSRV